MSTPHPQRDRPGLVMRMIIGLLPKITPVHVWLYRALGGRVVGNNPIGAPVLLVTTIGRRSGQPRTVTLGHMRIGDDVIVAGTNGGLPNLPAWVYNLRANPRAEVQLGQERYPVIAEFLEGEEWQHHWDRLVKAYPAYGDAPRYSGRKSPLIRLVRNAATST